jgi:uncharacterized protein YjbI with pentapeptide repeats
MNISKVGQWLGNQAKFLVAIALAAVIGGLTTAGVMAAIPDNDGKIYACYSNGILGRVKIIDNTTQTCGNNEAAINWSQDGSSKGVLVDIAGKDLSEANWVGWDLRNVNFTSTTLGSANLSGTDLRGATLTNVNMGSTNLRNSNLANQSFSGASLVGTLFNGANLTGVNFSNADIRFADFSAQNLSGFNFSATTSFENVILQSANFSDTVLPSAPYFKNANMQSANLDDNNFVGANFSGAHLESATFGDSDLTDVIWVENGMSAFCPDSTLASDHGDTCIGHL